MENTIQTVKKKSRFHIPLERKRQLVGYWFCLPVILGFFCIFIPGMISTFVYSFSEVQFNVETFEMDAVYVGFKNYLTMFDSVDFTIPLVDCLKDMAINVPVIVLFSFFLAIPVMVGVSFLKIITTDEILNAQNLTVLLTGMAVAYAVSMMAIKFLMNFVKKHDFKSFGWFISNFY